MPLHGALRHLVRVAPGDPAAVRAALAAEPDAIVIEAAGGDHGLLAEAARLARASSRRIFAGVPDLRDPDMEAALDAAMAAAPDGIVLADARGLADIHRLGARLAVREAESGLPDGGTAILARATDSAAGCLAIGSFRRGASARLAGLLCDPAPLRRALGCGDLAPALEAARTATVLAAASAGMPALLAVPGDADASELEAFLDEGFAGWLLTATHRAAEGRALLQARSRRGSGASG